jgi:hypothetical protein
MASGITATQKSNAGGQSSETVTPGQYYGLPGLTQFFELNDTQQAVAVTFSQTSNTYVNTLSQLTQDNIVFWWEIDVAVAQTYTAGTGGATFSPYFPWSYINSLQLALQSMYTNVNVDDGIDLYIFDVIRPMRGFRDSGGNDGVNAAEKIYAAGPPATGNPYNGTANTNYFATPVTGAASSMTALNFYVTLPGSLFIDEYWDMDMSGNLLADVAVPATVSPQYMAGAARQVQPKLTIAASSVADLSTGPANLTGNATLTGSLTFSVRRVGLYATENPATDPPVYAWQYQRISKSYPLIGSPVTVKLDEYAQILALFFRFWDPTLNGAVGGPVPLTNIARIQLQYGGSLYRFDDFVRTTQRRFYQQHRSLLPAGVLAWDLGLDPDQSGKVTNAYALNTLVTASPVVTISWISGYTPGAGSKVVVGYEELKYVIPQ